MLPQNEISYEETSILAVSESERMLFEMVLTRTLEEMRYDETRTRYFVRSTLSNNRDLIFYPDELAVLEALISRLTQEEYPYWEIIQ